MQLILHYKNITEVIVLVSHCEQGIIELKGTVNKVHLIFELLLYNNQIILDLQVYI